ncbi:PDZ domain-containing protein [Myxococcota bacterium]
MMNRLASSGLTAVLGLALGCGAVSEERFNALEAQVKQMQGAVAETGESDPKIASLEQRVAGFEQTTTETVKKIEEMLELLQREMSAAANPHTDGNDDWAYADAVLGIEEQGVKGDGDKYEVKKGYLARQVRAVAASGKGPKFVANKKGGMSIRGIKPKSIFDTLGLKNGDLITHVNGTAVATVADLSAALRQGQNPTVVKLQRKKKEITLTYTVAD